MWKQYNMNRERVSVISWLHHGIFITTEKTNHNIHKTRGEVYLGLNFLAYLGSGNTPKSYDGEENTRIYQLRQPLGISLPNLSQDANDRIWYYAIYAATIICSIGGFCHLRACVFSNLNARILYCTHTAAYTYTKQNVRKKQIVPGKS